MAQPLHSHQALPAEQGPHKAHTWLPSTLGSMDTPEVSLGKPKLLPGARGMISCSVLSQHDTRLITAIKTLGAF